MSSQPVNFGYLLSPRSVLFGVTNVRGLLDLARAVDGSGAFDSLWVGDSLLSKPRPDSLTLLGALAAITGNVTLGTACMASFPVRDPILVAHQWATLDQIADGRMRLAVCTGIIRHRRATGDRQGAREYRSAQEGAHWGVTNRQRVARMVEHMEICRRLWAEERVTFRGEYHSFDDLTLQPRPVQRPCPIWIAANPTAPKFIDGALQRVAHVADGWMTAQLVPGIFASNWAKLSAYLRAAGRDPQAFPNAVVHNLNINEDRAAALAETRRFLDEYYGPVLTPQLQETWTAYGSPAECADSLQALLRAGAQRIIIRPTTWDLIGQYKRLVDELLPRLNA